MPLYIAKSGDLDRCYQCLTDRLTDSQSKDSATQLLTKYKSGALVTQYDQWLIPAGILSTTPLHKIPPLIRAISLMAGGGAVLLLI